MSLQIGQRLGSYEITALLGKGGMGVVYRARDTKLKREVAIKILPDEFSRDADRVSRFQREAEVLASLNHPNIASIYDLRESEGARYLVLELIDGETLSERIRRGPIPVEEALDIAKELCEALEAAHEKGIIHRDLKPANVSLTPDGKVKVLDFGLAKAFETEAAALNLSDSPTLVSGTVPGVIFGTAAYMSPEQAKGKTVDRRADIWAFGVILFEMLTGRTLFSGETVSEIIAAVMMKEPDWNRLPANVPARVRDMLRHCLIKEPRHRVRDIGDARIAIEEVESAAEAGVDVAEEPPRRRSRVWVGIAAVLFLTTLISLAGLSVVVFNRATPPEIRLEVNTPSTDDPLSFAISPDGRRLVFAASAEGKSQLWVRPLDSPAAQPLAGTLGASYPFWSADSASVGFFADGKLKRIDIAGGAPQVLANAAAGRGGTWNRDGTILFASATTGPIFKVPATGGEPVAVTGETGQASHKFPQFLPDGRHFIYFVFGGPAQGVYSASLDGGPSKRLVSADATAVVSPSGLLLFPRQTTLLAQPFDFKRQELSGNPFPVVQEVAFNAATSAAGFSATAGILAYRTASAGEAPQLTWLDRSGKNLGLVGPPGSAGFNDVVVSSDGKQVAADRVANGNTDIWLIDLARGVPTRFTFDAAIDLWPVWSPDARRLAFGSNREGVYNLYWKWSSGIGNDELLAQSDQNKVPND